MTPETLAWIDQQKPKLVGWAESYVEESKLYAPVGYSEDDEPSHLSTPDSDSGEASEVGELVGQEGSPTVENPAASGSSPAIEEPLQTGISTEAGVIAEAEKLSSSVGSENGEERGTHFGKKEEPPAVSISQLRNLLGAAQAGSGLAVLVNYLRYQIGRERSPWRSFGAGTSLVKMLEVQVPDLIGQAPGAIEDEIRFELESDLSAQLVGFIIREYTYRYACLGQRKNGAQS